MYAVDISGDATEQIDALPRDALLAFVEAVGLLKVAPWSGRSINPDKNPAAPVRTLSFAGMGLVTYLILEPQRRVDVLMVQWLG